MEDATKTLLKSLYDLTLHAHHVIKKESAFFVAHMPQTGVIDRGGEGGRRIEDSSKNGLVYALLVPLYL